MLILTSKPRLFYLNVKSPIRYKGSIPWTLVNPIQCIPISTHKFDIKIADSVRLYHINDKEAGAERWIKAIAQVNEVWAEYFKASR